MARDNSNGTTTDQPVVPGFTCPASRTVNSTSPSSAIAKMPQPVRLRTGHHVKKSLVHRAPHPERCNVAVPRLASDRRTAFHQKLGDRCDHGSVPSLSRKADRHHDKDAVCRRPGNPNSGTRARAPDRKVALPDRCRERRCRRRRAALSSGDSRKERFERIFSALQASRVVLLPPDRIRSLHRQQHHGVSIVTVRVRDAATDMSVRNREVRFMATNGRPRDEIRIRSRHCEPIAIVGMACRCAGSCVLLAPA